MKEYLDESVLLTPLRRRRRFLFFLWFEQKYVNNVHRSFKLLKYLLQIENSAAHSLNKTMFDKI